MDAVAVGGDGDAAQPLDDDRPEQIARLVILRVVSGASAGRWAANGRRSNASIFEPQLVCIGRCRASLSA